MAVVSYIVGPPAPVALAEEEVRTAINNSLSRLGLTNLLEPTIAAAVENARAFGSPVNDGYTTYRITIEKVEG